MKQNPELETTDHQYITNAEEAESEILWAAHEITKERDDDDAQHGD